MVTISILSVRYLPHFNMFKSSTETPLLKFPTFSTWHPTDTTGEVWQLRAYLSPRLTGYPLACSCVLDLINPV